MTNKATAHSKFDDLLRGAKHMVCSSLESLSYGELNTFIGSFSGFDEQGEQIEEADVSNVEDDSYWNSYKCPECGYDWAEYADTPEKTSSCRCGKSEETKAYHSKFEIRGS